MGFFSTPSSPVERFAPDLLDQLSLGVSVYRQEDKKRPESFRLVYGNPASERLTGLKADDEVGRLLVDVVPGIVETGLLDRYAEVVQTGKGADLGLVTYGDERIDERTYEIRAIALPDRMVGVVFQDVTERAELRGLLETRDTLEREEARYRSLVEATAAIVWSTPSSGEFVDVPPQWVQVTGQTRDEASGQGWLDAIHPEDRSKTAEAWREAVDTKSYYNVEHRLLHADGQYRHMAARAVPILDEGEVVEWVGLHTDIEKRTQATAELAASETRFQALFDAIGDVVLVYPLGPDGPEPLVLFNQATIETYGYTPDELKALTIEGLVVPGRVDIEAALTELRRTRKATFDSLHVTKDGRRIAMSTSARLVEFDERLCVLALCRDDTERRQFRRELSRANHDLERAVAERTEQLEAFSEDLKILHGITTADHPTHEDRIDAYLKAGCEMFDLPVGILSATPLDPKTGERLYRIEAVISPDPSLEPGLTVPIGEAFCDAVLEQQQTVVYSDAASEAPDHPACAGRGLRAFIGTPVWVSGEIAGTLNFVSPEPRDGFSAVERDLIEVMAQAIGRRIESDRAEASQAEVRERYRTIVETVDSGVIVVDPESRIVMSNPAAREILGLEPGADGESSAPATRWPIVGLDGKLVDPEDLPEREALRTVKPVRGAIQGIRALDGPVRWYRVNATPVDHDQDGVPEAVVVSFHDVTDLRLAVEVAERAKDQLGDGLANASITA